MCIFCDIIDKKIDSKIIYEDNDVISFLDISQSTFGHTLVVPKKHYKNIYDIDTNTYLKLQEKVKDIAILITKKLNAFGCNILNNNNEIAGQCVSHMHIHIIPRYDIDEVTTTYKNKEKDLNKAFFLINN